MKVMKMNAPKRKLAARFEPDTRFKLWPAPPAPFRVTEETELERLKNHLLRERLDETLETEAYVGLRRAANEAAALARSTSFPLLVFPGLFDELAREAGGQSVRPIRVHELHRDLLAA